MSPNPNGTQRLPVGRLLHEIEETFGSFEEFKSQFRTAALDLFGSGMYAVVSSSVCFSIKLFVKLSRFACSALAQSV